MPRHTYATAADLADYPVTVDEADRDRLLADASGAVDELLEASVYPVDDDGMPTEPKHIEALALATCAVISWWDSIGDDGSGVTQQVQTSGVAGVNVSYKQGKPDRWGPAARRHLRDEGLLGGGGPGY